MFGLGGFGVAPGTSPAKTHSPNIRCRDLGDSDAADVLALFENPEF